MVEGWKFAYYIYKRRVQLQHSSSQVAMYLRSEASAVIER